jgi:MoaA/NifB/PqqE/SkfB family radical SAM enzyme
MINRLRKATSIVREHARALFPDLRLLQELDQGYAVGIEVSNICNANCVFCAYQYQERPKQFMSDEVFQLCLDQFVDLGGGVTSLGSLVGDPLLDPNYVERVRLARARPEITGVSMTTNVIHLDKVGARELLQAGVTNMTVSTTGFDEEMYIRIFRSRQYKRMKANLLDLLRVNVELGRPTRIEVGLRVDRPVSEVMSDPGFDEVVRLADAVSSNAYYDNWSGRIESADLSGTMKIRPDAYKLVKRRLPCAQLWVGTLILVDGTVTACGCRDLNGDSDLVLGNIRDTSLREMLRSERFHRLQSDWLAGKLPSICVDCRHYRPYTSITPEEYAHGNRVPN